MDMITCSCSNLISTKHYFHQILIVNEKIWLVKRATSVSIHLLF